MEIETVRGLIVQLALDHPKDEDSKELNVLRGIVLILGHIAESVHKLEEQALHGGPPIAG